LCWTCATGGGNRAGRSLPGSTCWWCAGIIRRGDEHDVAVFAEVLAINLTGTMRCWRSARKGENIHGAIVNTASMLSFFGGGMVPGYSASKGRYPIDQVARDSYASDGIESVPSRPAGSPRLSQGAAGRSAA
jgi:NAD(P)-dependent dehydrogenase (short-subunit alcohol dehydrogenase family)